MAIPSLAGVQRTRYAIMVGLRVAGAALVAWGLLRLWGVVESQLLVLATAISGTYQVNTAWLAVGLLAAAVPGIGGVALVKFAERIARALAPLPREGCPKCGYPVERTRLGRCPECGMKLEG